MEDDAGIVADAARAIASGNEVDWALLESSADERSSRNVLHALRRVADIVSFHRDLLHAGQRPLTWGSLTVIEEIGCGAFSRVYRAVDPRLDRNVALKLLDPAATNVHNSGTGVVEEGRLLARLRHPNIVSIHGANCVDGRVGLEMELITGETFHDIVRDRGCLGAEETMLVGRDLCRALAAIHGAGLVHRDIKAQNVMRERGGRVVLMDLGAGLQIDQLSAGGVTGTPLYLAPEILEGSPATARSDLYSVGVLLFYLVTATYPVTGGSIEGLREAHRTGCVARLRDLRAELPERFIRIIERALAHAPAERFDSAASFEAALSGALNPENPAPQVARLSPVVLAAAGAVAVMALVAWAFWPRMVTPADIERFAVPLETRLTRPSPPGAMEFAISADGRRLVYSENAAGTGARIYHRALNELNPVLVRAMDSGQPFLSPDGRWVGLHRQAGAKLVKVLLGGDALVELADWPRPAGAAWDRNGTIVLSSNGDLFRIGEVGGELVPVTHVDRAKGEAAIRPSFLPNGAILFTLRTGADLDAIAVVRQDGVVQQVLTDGRNGKYLPPGFLVFVRGDSLMVAPFDARTAEVTGAIVPIQKAGTAGWFDVSETGSLVYGTVEPNQTGEQARFSWFDRATGAETALPFPASALTNLLGQGDLSPDGRKIAVMQIAGTPETNPQDNHTPGPIMIGDLERGTMTPLTADSARFIAWTPDSLRVTFRNSNGVLVTKPVDGGSPEREVLPPSESQARLHGCSTGSWSPRERTLLMACSGGAQQLNDLIAIALNDRTPTGGPGVEMKPFLTERFGEAFPVFAPDGRWVAYVSTESGGREVYVRQYPGGGGKIQISTGGGVLPSWIGSHIFYFDYNARLPMMVDIETTPAIRVSRPRQAASGLRPGAIGPFQVSPDGSRLLALVDANPFTPNQLNVVLHWTEEVKRRVAGAR